jgi:hypothetical protein
VISEDFTDSPENLRIPTSKELNSVGLTGVKQGSQRKLPDIRVRGNKLLFSISLPLLFRVVL